MDLLSRYGSLPLAQSFERLDLRQQVKMETDVLLAGYSHIDLHVLCPSDVLRQLVVVDVLHDALGEVLRIDGVVLVSRH